VRTRPAETEVIADFLNTSSREPTVEVNLTQIYRKLNIRSRAELGRRIDRLDA
jgi:DNA-binding NarL/FixJ family response regulator